MRVIDGKFHTDGTEIIKTSNGDPIPPEEPLMLFRGRDRLVLPVLKFYRELCVSDGCTDYQLELLDKRIESFVDFMIQYPERMKQPGVTRGL